LIAAGVAAVAVLASTATVASASAAPRVRPGATIAGSLDGVGCASAKYCFAVGYRAPTASKPSATLIEKWNGTAWSVVSSPNPSGSHGAILWGVSCLSTKDCLAVGSNNTSTGDTSAPLAEQWNGSAWTLVTAPAPSGATQNSLLSISCVSSTDCWAAGASTFSSASYKTLIESWNGSAWKIVSSPSPNSSKPDDLSGIACGSASECWAVGYTFPGSDSGSLTEEWKGSTWAVVHTPSSAAGELLGDACVGASPCLAVGISDSLFALAQQWNGSAWVKGTPGKPSGATSSELNGVACTSATACESVGYYSDSAGSPTLAESWNGSKWALQSMPAVSGASFASLDGVACPAAGDCLAAGEAVHGSTTEPLLEAWNGKAWSVS
jgi:hypothetical protein